MWKMVNEMNNYQWLLKNPMKPQSIWPRQTSIIQFPEFINIYTMKARVFTFPNCKVLSLKDSNSGEKSNT
jgi:hypothetical protein